MTDSGTSKVVIGLSGGVDSAVAALLLLEQGFDVTGVFMKNWEDDDDAEYCAAARDLEDAQAVCDVLGISLRTVNFSADYWNRVFKYFLAEYESGRTPNPDVLCNTEIKFKSFLSLALDLGAEYIATGHYARVACNEQRCRLLTGMDEDKDQTYFLHGLAQDALRRTLFPLGELTKPDVRQRAQQAGLPVFGKKDSTGICFIGERKFNDFLGRYLQGQAGDIISADGSHVGTHQGLMFYTIGQRHGLGIGGPGEPWYVVDKDVSANILVVAQGAQHPRLYHRALAANDMHWISGIPAPTAENYMAKIRYRQPAQHCRLDYTADGRVHVAFTEPQRAITPGQSVVLYRDDECLGGGIIQGTIGACEAPAPDACLADAADG